MNTIGDAAKAGALHGKFASVTNRAHHSISVNRCIEEVKKCK